LRGWNVAGMGKSPMPVRTRFAPSPTGFLHIGGARTALFSRAYARRHGGKFILRIEDTDTERSTQASEAAILDSLKWLGLDWDEGPFFQMQRLPRYREVADQLIKAGHAYRCWATKEELDALREAQRARGEKPRYDGRWRPERAGAAGLVPPADRPPVVRFRTPEEGAVGWKDLVKGPIEFPNAELDDLVLLRADGVPTYNFGVVVDDLDMQITHVIRGDDHVNNTPRQIHIFRALEAALPEFAHVPMILGADGERLSKRHGAESVTHYRDEGFLPEALANYLARLGWSHGDEEVFSMAQLEQWFDLGHVSHSPAKFDADKLAWLNQHYMKQADSARLAALAAAFLGREPGKEIVALLKERAASVKDLAAQAEIFYTEPGAQPVPSEARPALTALKQSFENMTWERKALGAAVSAAAKAHNLKMPQLAMPLRRVLTGREQTPSIDAVLELLGREAVLARLARSLT
jgi:glutamyl-tRNA synthetase